MKQPIRILHLEDSAYDAELIRDLLETAGIPCVSVRVDNEASFLAELENEYDLILSDYSLPSFDGLRALAHAQEKLPDVPFIFVSAAMGEERAIDSLKRGATDYVLKQRLSRLVHVIQRAVKEKEDRNERRRAERALKENEERLRVIIETSPDWIWECDASGRITFSNAAITEITGYRVEEIVGASVLPFLHNDDAVRFSAEFADCVASRKGWRGRLLRWRHRDGTYRWLESNASPMLNNDGQVIGFRGVDRDISERKRLEEQLLHAQKMESLGTLAGGIAHDFNNILAILMGYSSLLAKKPDDREEVQNAAEAMATVIQRGAGLVRQLLTFARKGDASLGPVNPQLVIQEVAQMCKHTFPKTITITTRCAEKLPVIVANHNQLHQALLNLCVNARDAMPDGGAITITAGLTDASSLSARGASAEHYVRVSISDTGSGMDEATKARIFEPFFTTKEKGKGTGLGLAMVYGTVKSHQGFIDVESEPGKGTTFHLFFPVPSQTDKPEPAEETSATEPARGTETILLAEDEPALLELVKAVLEDRGYTVLPAQDGLEAVEKFKKHATEIDLVLLDLGLPKLSGWEAFLRMRELQPSVAALAATGYLDPEERSRMLEHGVRNFVEKPYTPGQLLRRVREALDHSKT
ncbi:MAG TPA: response regulator [Bacteroidota bacterium]|nr:response regulator [Bacteroidota bacterium]